MSVDFLIEDFFFFLKKLKLRLYLFRKNFFRRKIKKEYVYKSFDDQITYLNNYDFICNNNNLRIAVQIHLFYIDLLDEIISQLSLIPVTFDVLISTSSEEKKSICIEKLSKCKNINKIVVDIFENKGRDIYPFIKQINKYIDKYDILCHIHSKKTLQYQKVSPYGEAWRKYLYNNLFGSTENISYILNKLSDEKEKVGIIYPPCFPVLKKMLAATSEYKGIIKEAFEHFDIFLDENTEIVDFPVGSMFWVKTNAIRRMFEDIEYLEETCPIEAGQSNATVLHAYERLFTYISYTNGYKRIELLNNTIHKESLKSSVCLYAHMSKNTLEDSDYDTIKSLSEIYDSIYFVSSGNLCDDDIQKIKTYTKIQLFDLKAKNYFYLWKLLISKYYSDIKNYETIYFMTNECLPPVYNLKTMIKEMELRNLDFWGISIVENINEADNKYLTFLNTHLETYFFELNNNVFISDDFKNFIDNIQNFKPDKAFLKYELSLSNVLSEKFSFGSYFTLLPSEMTFFFENQTSLYQPQIPLLCRDPFLKKKIKKTLCNEDLNDTLEIASKLTGINYHNYL